MTDHHHGMPLRRRSVLGASLGLAGLNSMGARGADSGTAAPTQPVRVLASTDRAAAQPVIDSFERRHPLLKVDYVQLGSVELFNHFLAEGDATADVLWSSAMDLQIKLVNDGHASAYASPQAERLPRWAVWKQEAFATTYEPVGVAYHRELLSEAEVPRTHKALADLLHADVPRFRGRVATYDIERAGLGFLLTAHDVMATPRTWELIRALGLCQARLHPDTRSMLDDVLAGRSLLAYNVLGSYAQAVARQHPEVGLAFLGDYTLIASRVAFISRAAPNPAGARAWLDHLLSPLGQQGLAQEFAQGGGLAGVRSDAATLQADLARLLGNAARPIALGPALLAHLDRSTREGLLKRWRREFDSAR